MIRMGFRVKGGIRVRVRVMVKVRVRMQIKMCVGVRCMKGYG